MDEITGDMTSAVEAAFAASSTPEPAPTTAVDTPAPSATETATTDVSQAAATSTTTPEPKEGPVPYQRFKEINEKYGTTSKELEALAWAKEIPEAERQAFAEFSRAVRQNPLAMLNEVDALLANPLTAPAVRSWAARTLGTRTASRPTETVEDTGPEPDLQFEDGRKAYSAEQQLKREQWLLSQVDQKITPLAERQNRTEAEKQIAAIRAKATVDAKTEIDSLKAQYPQFEEHRKDVAAVMEANPTFTLKQAWAEVFVRDVGPKLAGQHAATVTKKVQAGSANPARPSGAATTVPDGFKSHLELLLNGNPNA